MGNKRTPEIYFRYCWGVANPLTDPPEWVELIFIPSWSSLGIYRRAGPSPSLSPSLLPAQENEEGTSSSG